jgi:SAM-dependent methyltransferase
MSLYDAHTYDSHYLTKQSKLENQEIQKLLSHLKGEILDVGCGTGLGYTLTRPNTYLGIDKDPEMIKTATKKHGKHFLNINADEAQFKPVKNIISLFAINYLKIETLQQMINNTHNLEIIHYNKPYEAGSTSQYTQNPKLFHKLHTQKKLDQIMTILQKNNATTTQLLNQPYYWHTTISTPNTIKNHQNSKGNKGV